MTQVVQGCGMPKKATHSKEDDVRFLASEIVTVYKHLQGGSARQRLIAAKQIVGDLLRTKTNDIDKINNEVVKFGLLKQAVGLLGPNNEQRTYPVSKENVVQKSYTKADVSDTAKDIKLPEPSSYQSYSECVDDIGNRFQLGNDIASQYCRALNTDATKGGVKSASTRSDPRPSWYFATGDGYWTHDAPTPTPNIKSASAPSEEYLRAICSPDGAAYSLERRHIQKEQRREESNRILSAKKKDEIPGWARASAADLI